VRAALPLLLALAALPAAAQDLDAQRQALAQLTAKEDALTGQIGATRATLAHLLTALELFRRDPPPPLLISAADARDAVRAAILAKALTPELQARVRVLDAQAQALAQVRRRTAAASGALFESESNLDDRQGRLDAISSDAALLAPPSARQAMAAAQATPPPVSFIAPTTGAVAVRYGGRLASGLTADGIAYRPAASAAVRAPAAGVVAYAGPVNGWGQVVILRAGGGCHMVLSGLGKVTVAEGQSVAAAAPIGYMPASGQSPPELYFEVRLAKGPIDPARMMSDGRAEH
jgi:septal ring factor EnvC (AmiA/AmiB activator)